MLLLLLLAVLLLFMLLQCCTQAEYKGHFSGPRPQYTCPLLPQSTQTHCHTTPPLRSCMLCCACGAAAQACSELCNHLQNSWPPPLQPQGAVWEGVA